MVLTHKAEQAVRIIPYKETRQKVLIYTAGSMRQVGDVHIGEQSLNYKYSSRENYGETFLHKLSISRLKSPPPSMETWPLF